MRIDRTELRKGLRETRTFLLAHHLPSEFYRCYSPVLFGRRVHVCARCLGLYPGILGGVLAYLFGPGGGTNVVLVAFLPLPALVDWTVTTFSERRGTNIVRTLTGALLGCGYGLGLSIVVLEFNVQILAIGMVYAILAALLLYHSLGQKF